MFRKVIAGFIIGSILVAEIPMSVMATEIATEDLSAQTTLVEQIDLGEGAIVTASQSKLLYSGEDVVPNDETGIPDPALYAALQKEMENFEGRDTSVTVEKLQNISWLDIYDTSVKIENLQGIEYCSNLERLTIPYHAVSDVSPLSGLTTLKSLNLKSNKIGDVSALSGLTALEELQLGGNLLTNATGLENMTFLRTLMLNDNQITDISALAGLSGIETLYLDRNKVSDISCLSGMMNLSFLSLTENQITDISVLAGLSQLQSLYLTDNQISDISALQGLVDLGDLHLDSNQISDIRPLSQMTNLWGLQLSNNRISSTVGIPASSNLSDLRLENNLITDLSGIPAAENLWSLYLDNNLISDITPLGELEYLYSLDIGNNQIRDISPLARLQGLQYLKMPGNLISDISALSSLTQLEELIISDNQINDISALASLSGLRRLDISDNQISDLGPLAGLSYLYSLLADNNMISNLEPLRNLTAMQGLELSYNQIVDVSPLAGMACLMDLYLSHNQIVNPTPLNALDPECRVDLSYNLITDASGLYLVYVNLEGNPCATPAPTSEPVVTEAPTTTSTPAPEPVYTPEPTVTPQPTATPTPAEIVVSEVLARLDAELAKKMLDRTIYVDLSDLKITTAEWESISASVMDVLNNNNIDYFFIYSMQSYKNIDGYVPRVSFAISQEFCEDGFVSWGKIEYQSKQLDYEIKCALSQIREDMSIAEKALVLQNYQILNCRFKTDCSDTDENSGAHASLLKSIGKPYNYADSMKVLLEAAGIEVRCYSTCSSDISWVLIQLEDGTWYSLDTMRDEADVRINGENISHDDGAVRYDNFLLGGDVYYQHFDTWNESTPLATNGSVFANYAFDELDSCLNPCGSYWYYLHEEAGTSYIVKTTFDGSSKERITLDEKAYYLFSYKDKLYYNTENKVYRYDPATGAKEVFYDSSSVYPGYVIFEFGVKHSSQAYLELCNEQTGDNQVLIIPFDSVPVDEIYLSASKLKLWEIGESRTLSTQYIPTYADSAPTFVWSSQDPTVATVDKNGLVTAVNWGTTTIIATTVDGAMEIACQVEVKDPGVSFVEFEKDTYYMNTIGAYLELYKDIRLSLYIAENQPQYTVWESSDPLVVSLDYANYATALSYGTATITVTTSDGVSDSCRVIVDPKAISALHLNVDVLKFGYVGLTRQLLANSDLAGTTNEDFEWSSSDTSVATVSSSGYVTAVGAGECVITVSCPEWNLADSVMVTVESDGGSADTPSQEQRALVKAFVERMYTVALGRESDPSGVNFWTDQLIALTNDGAALSRGFLLGEEFTGRGYSDSEYVKILYATFFDREADAAGESHWCNSLSAGATRAQVLAGFVNSKEFFELCADYGISRGMLRDDGSAVHPGVYRFAERLYSTILERSGDKDGIEYWSLLLDSKACIPEDAAIHFFWSGEYLSKNTTDEEYIRTLYSTFMARVADESGLNSWKNALESGVDRETVLRSFAACDEFKNIIASYGL